MSLERITDSLGKLFSSNRLVFWQDMDGEFEESIDKIALPDVEIVKLAADAPLKTKLAVELDRPDDKFLLYATGPRPALDHDWFLDIRHYAASFHADRASIILRDFGLDRPSLRDHLSARSKFLANQDRIERLRKLINHADGEVQIDLKIMAVLLKTDQADFFHLLMALLDQFAEQDDLDAATPALDEFEKYGVGTTFWEQCALFFSYSSDAPSLKRLVLGMMASDFGKALNGATPAAIKHLFLPTAGIPNAIVFLDRWRDSAARHRSYDILSGAMAEIVKLGHLLADVQPEYLKDAKTFLLGEQRVASLLARRIVETGTAIDAADVSNIAATRQNGYWANPKWGSTAEAPRQALHRVYEALIRAAELFSLRQVHADGFTYPTAKAYWQDYEGKLYRFDQLYRLFCEAADEVEQEGWDILKGLRVAVEDVYCNGYVANLALSWGKFAEQMIAKEWYVEGVDRQARFFNAHVAPHLNKGDDRRVFVIISDAFRYEAAAELTAELNGKYRLTADLSSQLGVLPSYTALGMASLLPHTELAVTTDANILVDGKPSSGLDNRAKILAAHSGVAVKAEDLMAMRKDAGRAFLEGKKVVYVYHNIIDQTADGGNEDGTFTAVRKTINDLGALVKHIVNSLNGNNVIVTADHGFLFQETSPTIVDKNVIDAKQANPIKAKKRYVIGTKLGENELAWHGKFAATSNVRDETEFWIPKGTNRFHFVGGARFIHGGAMLQEICVPVIKVSHKKDGKAKHATQTRTVGVTLLGNDSKITTNRRRFTLLQTEPVSDRLKAARVTIGIYDGNEPISSVETITLDSITPQMNEDWKKEIWLTLLSRTFKKTDRYNLIVRNTADDTEVVRQDVVIDLAFTNDF